MGCLRTALRLRSLECRLLLGLLLLDERARDRTETERDHDEDETQNRAGLDEARCKPISGPMRLAVSSRRRARVFRELDGDDADLIAALHIDARSRPDETFHFLDLVLDGFGGRRLPKRLEQPLAVDDDRDGERLDAVPLAHPSAPSSTRVRSW